jgi:hypothetical protein
MNRPIADLLAGQSAWARLIDGGRARASALAYFVDSFFG